MEPVVITGFAVRSALGDNIEGIWNKLLNNKSALQHYDFLEKENFRFTKACIRKEYGSNGAEMTEDCIDELIQTSNLRLPKNAGIFIGSTIGESSVFERAATDNTIDYKKGSAHEWVHQIKNKYDLHGHAVAYGNACAAGNYAIGRAAAFMQHYNIDVAIAGAAEPFSKIAMAGFNRSRAMSSDYCKPFDAKHNGMILGEGAAFFLLEKISHAKKRGAKVLVSVSSLGLSCDAYHATAPLPDGSGMRKAMDHALKQANLKPHQIDWICAHGSGTVASDTAEIKAIQDLFSDDPPLVSGYKAAFGHTLGASAAIELVICIKAMNENRIPLSTNFDSLPVSANINVCNKNIDASLENIMNCAYAFGGINSALILSKHHDN